MRIVAGAWRGRMLEAPRGSATRPTADRVRQALFDMLAHARWAEPLDGCHVLDAFAGSGALGLEALSRGAAHASFFETDRGALAALRANIATLGAAARSSVLARDATTPPPPPPGHVQCRLVLLDPPYGRDLITRSLPALIRTGWAASDALIVAECARHDTVPTNTLLAERQHGVAKLSIWRATLDSSS
ncbi:16S rRNA (guanine(966)-N(2))-methyltransferase RsmD [Lichenicoccus roseus]|uniref:16S rRNA (Guanine(966)-N(2))-methyltransferase RsmD n=1 Tax=Lichenicoccus roseus TaxID=2683649 RepID=A0A5R9J5P9_9PROT|nr:16S rRNA (guanine(966)-N(2))-methyltransferase RsmD [Lichenicoccus roseus]TLU71837.1 16S rRNA (guanine(966)-N(2))-methyltransferase RsmD [Lichenicoccus roseus]